MSNLPRTVALTVTLIIAAAVAVVLAGGGPAGAQTGSASGQPITDYATYPQPLPAGCPDGPAALVDVRFDNGRGGSATDLRVLDVRAGDTVSTSWADYAPWCRDAGGQPAIVIGMAAYDAGAPIFDPSIDQHLLPGWTVCGPGQATCPIVDGRFQLSIAVPTAEVACNLQVGAGIGLPLAVVGPSGRYYSAAVRGDQGPTLVISAINFATTPCPLPALAPETTTVQPTTPTAPPATAPPATAAPAVAPAAAAAPLAAQPVSVASEATAAPAGVAATEVERPLPRTGRNEAPAAVIGALLVLGGALALSAERSRRGYRS